MISLSMLATNLQAQLNDNKFNIKFKIFSDGGKFERALKTRTAKTRYTNGVLIEGTSSIVPTQGLTVATQNALLRVVVQLPVEATQDEVIAAHRAVLDDKLYDPTVQIIDGFTVSAVYSLANTGELSIREGIGASIEFTVAIAYSYISNGLNSNNFIVLLDGDNLPFSSLKITKTPVSETDTLSNTGGRSVVFNTAFARSFDFQIPATTDAIGKKILNQIIENDLNVAHKLKFIIKVSDVYTKQSEYTVIFGHTDMTVQGINNAGFTVSFVERMGE